MAAVSLIFIFFAIIIIIVAGVPLLIGIALFIISAVMKKKQLTQKKEAELAGNYSYQIDKSYIIPRVFGFIFMIPLVICIISIVYIIKQPANKQTATNYVEENSDTSKQTTEKETPETLAKNQAALLIENIENRDTASIINMFCDYEKTSGELSGKIETLLDFIDGDIVSYDEPNVLSVEKERNEGGQVAFEATEGKIGNIKTPTGKIYNIFFYSYHVYPSNPEYVGIFFLEIEDADYEPDSEEGHIYVGEMIGNY